MFKPNTFSRSQAIGRIAIAALLANAVAASAVLAAEPALQMSYAKDGSLTCEELLAEASRMDGIMGVSADAQARAEGGGRAAELGASVAINGALYSGALGAVPGLGLFANGAAAAAKRNAAAKAQREAELRRTAEGRRAIVMGLYQGKNCAAAQVASAAPAKAPAPAN